jgi:hypothetical protein
LAAQQPQHLGQAVGPVHDQDAAWGGGGRGPARRRLPGVGAEGDRQADGELAALARPAAPDLDAPAVHLGMDFFNYRQEKRARDFFNDWYVWASRSRLKPVIKLAKTLNARLGTLLNYGKWPISNAKTEALNSKIQWIKYTARGFRSRDGFRRAIFFHCGGLDLYPQET